MTRPRASSDRGASLRSEPAATHKPSEPIRAKPTQSEQTRANPRNPPPLLQLTMPTVRVYVTLKPSLLDSAGRTVTDSLQQLGFNEVQDARIGKLIELKLDPFDEARVREMGERLLANPVIEDFRIEVMP